MHAPVPRWLALTCVAAVLVAAAGTWCATAHAGESASELLRRGDVAGARAALARELERGPGRVHLLHHAWLARMLQDIDLLRRVRERGEELQEEHPEATTVRLALGFAYLGLAEENLRLRTGSGSVSLYFADAESYAKRAAEEAATPELLEAAARLAAEARYAQGDLPGAIARLTAHRAAHPETSGVFDALAGRYEYERAAGLPTQPDGRPTDEASAGLRGAIAHIGAAFDDHDGERDTWLFPMQVRKALMTRAYAYHRLGHVAYAESDYRAAYRRGGDSAVLVLRGLASLYGNDPAGHAAALGRLLEDAGRDGPLVRALVAAHRAAGDAGAARAAAEAWLEEQPDDAGALVTYADELRAAKDWDNAIWHYTRALLIDPGNQGATYGTEMVAQALAGAHFAAAADAYETLLRLRPRDPYVRNNYGFLLRENVSPWTDLEEGGLQRLRADAPPRFRRRLERCVAVYAEAAALIDPELDGTREEMEAWDLAGIVNDYGLMLHYFVDVQDAPKAEAQYLRALRMTADTFKDTYSPNLHRLYRYVLTDRLLTWYRLAREARNAIYMEQRVDGRLELVPDERKRAAAQRDMEVLRARILQELKADVAEDGLSWPPGEDAGPAGRGGGNDGGGSKENGNDR